MWKHLMYKEIIFAYKEIIFFEKVFWGFDYKDSILV